MSGPLAGQLAPAARLAGGGRRRGERPGTRIHWSRTLLAKGPAPLRGEHLRWQREAPGGAALHCLLLDCSASMLRRRQLSLAKALLQHWSAQLYRTRSELLVIGFSGRGARVLFGPAPAKPFNEQWIAPIGGGGATPLGDAVVLCNRVISQARRRRPGLAVGLWLLSDGRFDELPAAPTVDAMTLVDFDDPRFPVGRLARLATLWQAPRIAADAFAKSR